MPLTIVTEPQIYLVGRQQVDSAELGRFLADLGASDWTTDTSVPAERLVEVAGRNCYASYAHPRPGGNKAYIGHLLEVGHGSVIEHASWSFIIKGISRSLSHELIRHRVGCSYSQLSQRYVDESEVAFVVPPALLGGDTSTEAAISYSYQLWQEACERALDVYRSLVGMLDIHFATTLPDKTERRKAVREAARSVLPNCTETAIFLTANARSLRWLLEQRGSRQADAEFRRLSFKLLAILQTEAPNLFGDLRVVEIEGGRQEIVTEHRKV